MSDPRLNGPAADVAKAIIREENSLILPGLPRHNVVMDRGEGAFLYDLSGNAYIDFNAGFSSCNQGHCHPKVVAAMVEQCAKLAQPSRAVYTTECVKLCRRLSELTGFGKVSLLQGGVEATDSAVKIARAWGYKVKGIPQGEAIVLMAEENFHGRSLSILSGSTDASEKTSELSFPAKFTFSFRHYTVSLCLITRLWAFPAQHRPLLRRQHHPLRPYRGS